MIITRTPLRVSIGGGGTDLPSYYEKFGGFWISAAINRYIYISINKAFKKVYTIKYSQIEQTERIEDIRHPIVREALTLHEIPPTYEIASMADIPAGTGLGSSGSFNVGLLRALYAVKREHVSTHALAEEACMIEIEKLKEPIGKQDQFIAAFGGLNCFTVDERGTVTVQPLRIQNETLHDLEDNLLMFFTGYSRSASEVLSDQKKKSNDMDKDMLESLHHTKALGLKIKDCLESGNTYRFGELMHEHWLHKKGRSKGISNPQIEEWYNSAIKNGAVGGKLIGAGGGGFLMFYANDRVQLRNYMAKEGLSEVRFNFDFEGSKVLVNEENYL